MPIEASGQDWFHFAYDVAWRHHAEFFSTHHAKVLVRDNPGFDETEREEQAKRLSDVSTWATKAGKSLIIELLVPASEQDMNDLADNTRLYEDTVRPDHMVSVIEYLQDRGVDPAIWKVEGLSHHSAAIAVAEAARRGGRQAKCIVLGRHASHDQLDRWLQVAAPIPGFVGFAIGRSIWWDALHSHLRHHGTAGEARRHITSNYLDFVNYYLAARDGDLTNPDPTFW
jgi:5-dehydro-2-deoxygluconokinase